MSLANLRTFAPMSKPVGFDLTDQPMFFHGSSSVKNACRKVCFWGAMRYSGTTDFRSNPESPLLVKERPKRPFYPGSPLPASPRGRALLNQESMQATSPLTGVGTGPFFALHPFKALSQVSGGRAGLPQLGSGSGRGTLRQKSQA